MDALSFLVGLADRPALRHTTKTLSHLAWYKGSRESLMEHGLVALLACSLKPVGKTISNLVQP